LGVELDADYLEHRERSDRLLGTERKRRRDERDAELHSHESIQYETMLDAYLAGDFPALYAMECERDGVDPETP
jgi:hypothetical protein